MATKDMIHVDVGNELSEVEYHAVNYHALVDQAQGDSVVALTTLRLGGIAKGTAGQIWRMNSGGTLPEWGAAEVGARVRNSAAQAIAHNTDVALTFDTEDFDNDTIHDTGSNTSRLTCKTAGKYLIIASVRWEANAIGQRQLYILLNGTTSIAAETHSVVAAVVHQMHVAIIYDLSVDDYVEEYVYQNSTAEIDSTTSGVVAPTFMMQRIG